jgi:hypothetical protein
LHWRAFGQTETSPSRRCAIKPGQNEHDPLPHQYPDEFYKGHAGVIRGLNTIGAANLAISAVTVGELYYGTRDRHRGSS